MQAAKTRERRAVHAGPEAGKGLAGKLWEGLSETAKGSGLHHKHTQEGWSTRNRQTAVPPDALAVLRGPITHLSPVAGSDLLSSDRRSTGSIADPQGDHWPLPLWLPQPLKSYKTFRDTSIDLVTGTEHICLPLGVIRLLYILKIGLP